MSPDRVQMRGGANSAYTERCQPNHGTIERWCAAAVAPVLRQLTTRKLQPARIVQAVNAHGDALHSLATSVLDGSRNSLRERLRKEGFSFDVVAQVFALIRESAERTLNMRPFDVQVIGGWIMVNGMIAEMDTGEGKTLTATLPACAAALAGLPVHILTVNDYLARRDAELMTPLYKALGLSVAVVTHEMELEARRAAYACDVVYCTNKELVFDYLRDRIILGRKPGRIHLQLDRLLAEPKSAQLRLRGLHFAIIDEADSILIDEARTPLIISNQGDDRKDGELYAAAMEIAAQLNSDRDFELDERRRAVDLTRAGRARVAEVGTVRSGVWKGGARGEELVRQALTAQYVMQRDLHYIVKDDKVQIIDDNTGRVMGDRSWEHGLHQMIEIKEGCSPTAQNDPVSRITYQRFFRRYLRIAGMTGTAREVRSELWSVYRLAVIRVPTNRPRRRIDLGTRVCASAEDKWLAVIARIQAIHNSQRPVLVGTRSVAASERLSRLLTECGLPHRVLNARQDREEAEIVAQVGEPGRITVATNMAGRGTDIRLGAGVSARGGLHVIGTELHEVRRIDRQLFGRCGRQGDPGSYEMIVSLDDEIFLRYSSGIVRLVAGAPKTPAPFSRAVVRTALAILQRGAERMHRRIRRDLLRAEDRMQTSLAFAGFE